MIEFLFLFGVSLSLNFYLLFFNGKNPVEIAKVIPPKEASINLLQSQVEGLASGKNIPLEKIVLESAKIQPVSFSKSDDISIGDIAAKSLEFKVRNSLNYTVCKIISRQGGCAALSAHMGRLMSWFFNINKSIRNGDVIKVVYQKLDGPKQFKILKLSYNPIFDQNNLVEKFMCVVEDVTQSEDFFFKAKNVSINFSSNWSIRA